MENKTFQVSSGAKIPQSVLEKEAVLPELCFLLFLLSWPLLCVSLTEQF